MCNVRLLYFMGWRTGLFLYGIHKHWEVLNISYSALCPGQCELRTPLMMDHVRFVFQDDLTNPLKEFMRANNLVER